MDLTRFYRMIRKSWLVLAGLALAGGAIGAVIAYITPPTYSASTRLFVSFDSPATSTSGDLVQANNFAIQKVFSYIEVVDTEAVLGPVIADLGLADSTDELSGRVAATVPLNSVVLSLTAQADNPTDAALLSTAVADSFTDYVVNTLESPSGGGPGPVKVVVLQPAAIPLSPSSPSLITNVAVGIFAGLFAGFLLVFLLTLRDKRLYSRVDLERLGVGYLGGLPEFPRRASPDYVALRDAPAAPEAESVRRIRTRLAITGSAKKPIIGIVSSIDGEGASTFSANLAAAFVEGGESVAVVDADVREGRQRELLGIPARTRDDIIDNVGDARLVLLEAAAESHSGDLDKDELDRTLAKLSQAFDVVIVDAPPVLRSDDALLVAHSADRCILVAASGRVDLPEVESAVEALRGIDAPLLASVVTHVPLRGIDADPSIPAHARDNGRRVSHTI